MDTNLKESPVQTATGSLATSLGEEVLWANLQTPFFAPGIGNLKETLVAAAVSADLKMYLDGDLLRVFMKGKRIGIPITNVKTLVFK